MTLRCPNCEGPVDINAVACPRCGRPKAGEEAASNARSGCLAMLVIGGAFMIYVMFFAEPTKPKPASPPPPQSAPVDAQANPPPTVRDAPRTVAEDRDPVAIGGAQDHATVGEASLRARLVDNRGKIVLQSGPSMFSRNVAELPAGTAVRAEVTGEKWVRVTTDSGLVGYVRKKQLSFTD